MGSGRPDRPQRAGHRRQAAVGAPVESRLSQWFFKITDYAQDLPDGCLAGGQKGPAYAVQLDRPIGRPSNIFELEDRDDRLEVYTTRPDTIFGASFCAISLSIR